jgi:hypothetical protein
MGMRDSCESARGVCADRWGGKVEAQERSRGGHDGGDSQAVPEIDEDY